MLHTHQDGHEPSQYELVIEQGDHKPCTMCSLHIAQELYYWELNPVSFRQDIDVIYYETTVNTCNLKLPLSTGRAPPQLII